MQFQAGGSGAPTVNFSSFKDSLSQGVSFLKRRFSSDDLSNQEDEDHIPPSDVAQHRQQQQQRQQSIGSSGPPPPRPASQQQQSRPQQPPPTRPDFNLQGVAMQPKNTTISAPTSPAKSQGPAAVVQGLTRNILQAATSQSQKLTGSAHYNKEHCKCLLVIDNSHVDWLKYFKNRKILGDWDLRVEQAGFECISIVSSGTDGCLVYVEGGKCFKPDFVFVRQPTRHCQSDWRRVVIGFLYGGIPGLNSMQSLFNFAEKPWVFAHLLMLYRRLGPEKFPLIDQLYSLGNEKLSAAASFNSQFPLIIKSGHAHSGTGKIKINNPMDLVDVESLVAVHADYATLEPYVDAKYDVQVQKIGQHYKAFMRKGISNSWKSNRGSAMLEQVAVTDKYRLWVDEVAQLFGGMDVCCVAALVAKDGREIIYEINDCTFPFLGDTQEEDRRVVADLVLQKMNHILGIKMALQQKEHAGPGALQNYIKHESSSQPPRGAPSATQPQTSPSFGTSSPPSMAAPPAPTTLAPSSAKISATGGVNVSAPSSSASSPPTAAPSMPPRPRPPPPLRQNSAASGSSVGGRSDPLLEPKQSLTAASLQNQVKDQVDDTMSNLKKTFAGIFGDM